MENFGKVLCKSGIIIPMVAAIVTWGTNHILKKIDDYVEKVQKEKVQTKELTKLETR